MKDLSIGAIFAAWLKEHRNYFILFVLAASASLAVAAVYRSDMEPVWYSIGIVAFVGALWGVWSLEKYYSRHKACALALQNLESCMELLPKPQMLSEEDDRNIIGALSAELDMLRAQTQNFLTETNDYYTMWVHQIKTPIAAMRLLLQSEPAENSFLLEQELFKIEQYAEMVLYFLRAGQMSSDLLLKEYNLEEIVRTAVKKYSVSFIAKKLSLSMEVPAKTVLTDEKWLGFAIEQILSNCVKYTKSGGITIRMTDNAPDTLFISDTGIGIAEEDLPRIFEKGFTGYNGRMDKKSTGIGLYLCKMILDKLNYKIAVTSEIGKGTAFAIDLSREEFLQK